MLEPAGQPNPGGGSTTLEEYEAATATPAAPPKAAEFKLEGDDIPEEFRGKTALEIATQAKAFQNALRMSEDARVTMKTAFESRPAEPAPKPVEEEPEMTREQLKELYDTDPLEAMAKMTEIAEKRATKNFSTRLGQMESSGVGLAENWARQEFPDEFKLFGEELDKFVKQFPPATFTTKKGWEEAISFVRGKRGNFEKLMEFRQNGPPKGAAEARMEQETTAGHSGGSNGQRGRVPTESPTVLDATQKQIAQEFINSGVFKDEAEYVKWSKIGAST